MANSELIDDAVSRQEVRDTIFVECSGEKLDIDFAKVLLLQRAIRALPPVIPTRQAGKWIFTKTIFDKHGCTVECPSCHKKWKTYDEIRWKKENKFCPNCGTDMRGDEQ